MTPECVLSSSLYINESLLVNIKAETDLITVNNDIVDAILAGEVSLKSTNIKYYIPYNFWCVLGLVEM